MKEIILIGGGGHCRSVIDIIEQEGRFKIAGIVEKSEVVNGSIQGYPIIGTDQDLKKLAQKYNYALITVGQIYSPKVRIHLFQKIKEIGYIIPKIVSPRAYISLTASVGEGTIIMHDALINANVEIGNNCIINSKVLVEHDCKIYNDCHISTNATINGGVIVESGCFIGSSVVTKELIVIKKNSFIKAGSIIK